MRALSTDRRVAERMRSDIINQRDLQAAGLGAEVGQSMPLAELVELYLSDSETRASQAFVYNAKVSLRRTLTQLRAQRVRDLRPLEVIQLRARLTREGLANSTANQTIGRLSAALTWGVRHGVVAENPIKGIAKLPEGEKHMKRRRRALSDDEIRRFLAAAEEDDRQQAAYLAAETTITNATRGPGYAAKERRQRIPQATLWLAFRELGARYGELTAVTWGDLDLEAGTLRLRGATTKSGKTRVVPVLDGLAGDLARLRAIQAQVLDIEPGPGDRVFLTPRGAPWPRQSVNLLRLFDRVCELAGIERVNAHGECLDVHALRHSAASWMARSGVPQTVTAKLLGHADGRMTSRAYVHLDVRDLRDALESAGGWVLPPRPQLVRIERTTEATA
jgi:integrase